MKDDPAEDFIFTFTCLCCNKSSQASTRTPQAERFMMVTDPFPEKLNHGIYFLCPKCQRLPGSEDGLRKMFGYERVGAA